MNITDKKRRDVVVEVVVEDRMWAKHYAQRPPVAWGRNYEVLFVEKEIVFLS